MQFKQEFKTKENILSALLSFDYACKREGLKADLVILGAAAILMIMSEYGSGFRRTKDIDVEILKANDIDQLRQNLAVYKIDEIGGVMEVPGMDEFEIERGNVKLIDMPFENLNIYLPNIEILACCKIFSKRQKDLDDLIDTDILKKCDKDILMEMVDEYKGYVLNLDDPDINVHQLSRIFEEKGI